MPRAQNYTASQSIDFWNQRPFRLVGNWPIDVWRDQWNNQRRLRNERQQRKVVEFEVQHQTSLEQPPPNQLLFWGLHQSWTFCETCRILTRLPMTPTFRNARALRTNIKCSCSSGRYVVPCLVDIPFSLRDLTQQDIFILRPFDLHSGQFVCMPNGYLQKNGFSRVSASAEPVEAKIYSLTDPNQRLRCQLAYRFLTTSPLSSYLHFVELRQDVIESGNQINMYHHEQNAGLECALWPHLYPLSSWCETSLSGNTARLSTKVSYMNKILSEILDYSLDFELLQFQYDRWLFNTVTGAISSGISSGRSPATCLDAKTFSPEYWKWQHRFLLDALRQYGYPSLFLTISPFEWTFPWPQWLLDARSLSGKGPTGLPCLETLHILHVLEQTVRGYLCGTNSQRWFNHVFNYNNLRNKVNVKNFFFRIEFQHRGTAHVHLLVWLDNIKYIQRRLLRADIPLQDPNLAFLVTDLQPSNSDVLPLREEPSCTEDSAAGQRLLLDHPGSSIHKHSGRVRYSLVSQCIV